MIIICNDIYVSKVELLICFNLLPKRIIGKYKNSNGFTHYNFIMTEFGLQFKYLHHNNLKLGIWIGPKPMDINNITNLKMFRNQEELKNNFRWV